MAIRKITQTTLAGQRYPAFQCDQLHVHLSRFDAASCNRVKAQHDYEPSTEFHPMHTDPTCVVCGAPKGDH